MPSTSPTTLIENAARRHFLLQTGLACATLGAGAAWAETAKPLRILVGFPAGGGSDAIARLLQERLREQLGTTVLVENRPGAGGQIAAQALKAAPADGSTIFLSHDHTISILPQVVKAPGFDPAQDFVPVGGFASFVNCLAVNGAHPARSFDEYVDWVRKSAAGKSAVGIPAPASTPEFLVKTLAARYQLDLVAAPYRGSAPMIGDLLGRQIEAGIGSVQDFMEYHKSGKLRVLAVLGGKRQPLWPEVPTFAELGFKGFEDMPYYGFYAPKGTPQAFTDRFAAALAKVVAQSDIHDQLVQMGLVVGFMSPQQLAQRERAYTRVWKDIIQKTGFQPQ